VTITEARIDSSTGWVLEDVPTTQLSAERCHLGEGPTYDAPSDTAWWFDILERRLFEARLHSGEVFIHALPFMASALAYVDEGRQLLAAEDGLYLRRVSDGVIEPLIAVDPGPSTRSNDSRVHPSGTFWTSTMGRRAEVGAGSIYAFYRGELKLLFADITIPNAICFSPDGAIGYFADTYENVLYRVPLDPATGLPADDPSPLYTHKGVGGLDGAVTDAEGLIWCARWGGSSVDVYRPNGTHLRSVATPALKTSCPAFVGKDFSRMLVTSAHEGSDEAARAADPEHGRTFIIDPGVRGKSEPRVRLRDE
jgi:sugar lactone lactonase YvrE